MAVIFYSQIHSIIRDFFFLRENELWSHSGAFSCYEGIYAEA